MKKSFFTRIQGRRWLVLLMLSLVLFALFACAKEEPTDPPSPPASSSSSSSGDPTPPPTDDRITVTGITFESASFEYDGTEKHLAVGGTPLPEGVSVQYYNNGKTEVGEYTVTAVFTVSEKYHPIADMTAILTVTAPKPQDPIEITGITFEDASFPYDGGIKSLSIGGTPLPDGVTVTYTNNGKTEIGSYKVIAHFTVPAGYLPLEDMTATLEIYDDSPDAPSDDELIEITGITFEDEIYEYDGAPKTLTVNGDLPEGTEVTYIGNGKTVPGKYTVIASFSVPAGYKPLPEMTATLEITPLTVTGITFEDATFAYDGGIKSLAIGGTPLPTGVSVEYIGNGKSAVGEYKVTARFTVPVGYAPIADLTATLTIYDDREPEPEPEPPKTVLITYYLNGGIETTENPRVFTVGSSVALSEPRRDGHVFGGWYTNSGYEGAPITVLNDTTVTGALSLYAKWTSESTAPTDSDYQSLYVTRGLKVLLLSYGEYGRDTLTLDGGGAGTWRSLTSDGTAYTLKGATGNAVGTYSFEYNKSYRTDAPNAYALDARYFGGDACRVVTTVYTNPTAVEDATTLGTGKYYTNASGANEAIWKIVTVVEAKLPSGTYSADPDAVYYSFSGWRRNENGAIGYDLPDLFYGSNPYVGAHYLDLGIENLPKNDYTVEMLADFHGVIDTDGYVTTNRSYSSQGDGNHQWGYTLGAFQLYARTSNRSTFYSSYVVYTAKTHNADSKYRFGAASVAQGIHAMTLTKTAIESEYEYGVETDGNSIYTLTTGSKAAYVPNESIENGLFRFFENTPASLYALRVYDVTLTDAEKRQNHFADLAAYYGISLSVYHTLNDTYRALVHTKAASMQIGSATRDGIEAMISDVAYMMQTTNPSKGQILINEVVGQNNAGIADSRGDYSDWVEILNTSKLPLNLSGCSFSDDEDYPARFVFGDVVLAPGGRLILFCSGEESVGDEMHAPFKISAGGETLYLYDADGNLLDKVEVPETFADAAYARTPDGGTDFSFRVPTPATSNSGAAEMTPPVIVTVTPPTFSLPGGFYNSAFNVTINAAAGLKIYYTTDSSTPTIHSIPYSGAISVSNLSDAKKDRATVLRAIAVDANGNVSAPTTVTYFIGYGNLANYNNLILVSLVTDPAGLYDESYGIFTNYNNTGRDWERETFMDYYSVRGNTPTLLFAQTVGIRVHGGASRTAAQKSVRVYAREEYSGSDLFPTSIVGGVDATSVFILRNGGNDQATKLHDVYLQSLVTDRNFATQGYRIAAVFLNGTFNGVYNVQEYYNDDYVSNRYGIDKKNLYMVKKGESAAGGTAALDAYNELRSFVRKANFADGDEDYEKLCQMVDIQSYIDYMCAEIYISNVDWPGNNYEMWRSASVTGRPYEDGRWRWMLYDTEFSSGADNRTKADSDAFARARGDIMFQYVIKNATFRAQFVNTMMDLINQNFDPLHADAALDAMVALYTPAMVTHYRRYGGNAGYTASAYANSGRITTLRTFMAERPAHVIAQIPTYFTDCGEAVTLTVTASLGGGVKVNTVTPDLSSAFYGTYYSGYAIPITAEPRAGYRFTGWYVSGGATVADAKAPTTTVTLTENGSVHANYAVDPDYVATDTLASFYYYGGSSGGEMTAFGTKDGYAATGGVLKGTALLTASVNGANKKLEWSKDPYTGKYVPITDASAKNPWDASAAGFTVRLSTKGYKDIRFTASIGASKSGPVDYVLSYSTDGVTYTELPATAYTLARNKEMFVAFDGVALPASLADADTVYIRIAVASDENMRGEPLTGTAGGEFAINNVSVTGTKK